MRIAYLINQYPQVSHTFIRREILALERQGFEIMRISIRGWASDLLDPADIEERERTRYVLRSGWFALAGATLACCVSRPFRFMRAVALAIRLGWRAERALPFHLIYLAEACLILTWLREQDIGHLHAHFGTNSAEVATLVHELGGPPFSFTVHGPEEFDKARFIGLPEKTRRARFVIAISSFTRSQLLRLVDHQEWDKISVVRCGLEPEFFGAPPTYSYAPQLVCVGRLCEQKGQLLLIDAARRLAENGVAFTLTLVGDGELRPAIESLIRKHCLEARVNLVGWVSNEEVRHHILQARALVLPSFAEGLPVAIMEAMALRRPVISTFIAGIPELVRNGENGWLVPSGDVDALLGALKTCLAAPQDVLQRMSNAAFQEVCRSHDLECEAERLATLFNHQTSAPPDDDGFQLALARTVRVPKPHVYNSEQPDSSQGYRSRTSGRPLTPLANELSVDVPPIGNGSG
jgi:colanic acid/amylovoran biosynthesis glycosyltransferase